MIELTVLFFILLVIAIAIGVRLGSGPRQPVARSYQLMRGFIFLAFLLLAWWLAAA